MARLASRGLLLAKLTSSPLIYTGSKWQRDSKIVLDEMRKYNPECVKVALLHTLWTRFMQAVKQTRYTDANQELRDLQALARSL